MTVCIAAICDSGGQILGASDRMISGLAQYQGPDKKVSSVTSSIVVMWAGEAALQAEIIRALRDHADELIKANPKHWLNVRDVAYMYQHHYNTIRLRRVEQGVLAPFGLNFKSFTAEQKSLTAPFVRRIASAVQSFPPSDVEALIVGMDTTGAHIYSCNKYGTSGDVMCHDSLGFAAIGSGSIHAESQFMLARHGPSRPGYETLFLTFLAKKRAQSAPGVGSETDLFYFRYREDIPAMYWNVGSEWYDILEKEYNKLQKQESLAMDKGKAKVKKAFEEFGSTPSQSAAQASAPDPGARPDAKPASDPADVNPDRVDLEKDKEKE